MSLFASMNPYYNQDFLGFIGVFFYRVYLMLSGQVGFQDLVSDEIQIFVLSGVALSTALVGTFLVLRRMTMLANALSHTILIGIVVAYIVIPPTTSEDGLHAELPLQGMLFASLLMGLVTTFITEFLTRTIRLQEDASIGIVFTSLFALGVILVTIVSKNSHIGTEIVMGNVDALHRDDLKLVFVVFGLNLLSFLLFFKEFQITTFDQGLARSLGISTVFFNYLLMIQVSATAVGAFRAVGVLMVLAFMTGPVLIARLLTDDLKKLIFFAPMIGVVTSFFGVAIARHLLTVQGLALTTGGIVVCMIVAVFLVTLLYKSLAFRYQITLGSSR